MRESSIVVRPESAGSPFYTPSTRLDAAGLRQAIARFEQIAATVPLPTPPHPVVIADYGASIGYNSLLPIGAAIRVFRSRTRRDHAVLVAHTDLPENDFSALFKTLAEDPDSYTLKDPANFPVAIGRSFYAQILPAQSVHLGWTSWATTWLSRATDELPEVPDHVQVGYSHDDRARTAYARQAARDWQDFVAFRGRELSPGGKILVLTTAIDHDGGFGYRPLLDAIVATLDALAGDGLLSGDEVRRMTIPVVGRSEADLRAPFAPSGRFEGTSVEYLELFNADDRFWNRHLVDGDAGAFGARWAAFARASIFPTLATALNKGDKGSDDARASLFAQRLEAGVAARLAGAPEQLRIPLALAVLSKDASPS